jgi:hypothetical protein
MFKAGNGPGRLIRKWKMAEAAIKIDETRMVEPATTESLEILNRHLAENFLSRASYLAERGIAATPVRPGTKRPFLDNWAEEATADLTRIAAWYQEFPDHNVGAVAKSDHSCMFDDDSGIWERIEKEIGFIRPSTFTCRGAKGSHSYFLQTDASRALGNYQQKLVDENGDFAKDANGKEITLFDFQQNNKIVVGPGSLHPSGIRYEVIDDSPLVPIPGELVAWLVRFRAENEAKQKGRAAAKQSDVPSGAGFIVTGSLSPTAVAARIMMRAKPYETEADRQFSQAMGFKHRHLADVQFAMWLLDKSMLPEAEAERLFAERKLHQDRGRQYDRAILKKARKNLDHDAEEAGKQILSEAQKRIDEKSVKKSDDMAAKLLSYAELIAQREAVGNLPEMVEGLLPDRTVNIIAGDSGLGKTPLALQLGICVAFEIPFLKRPTRRGRVLIVDYENPDLIDRLTEIGGYLNVPLPMDANWLRVMQSPTQEEIAAAIEYFGPQLVVVDGLRGIDPQIEKTEVASRVLGECQKISLRKGLSWLFIHNIRKGSEKANEEFKLDLFDTDTRVMEWMEKVAGSRGLINQTSVRIGIDQVKRARGEEVLGLRGFYKGKGEFGPIKIARQFDESGEPVGYYLVCGASLLSQDDIILLARLPVNEELTFGQVRRLAEFKSDHPTADFLKRCEAAGTMAAKGKPKSKERRYISFGSTGGGPKGSDFRRVPLLEGAYMGK